MARLERNDVDYFPHIIKDSDKMFYLEQKYKNNGYAVWFKLLEKLGTKNYHYLELSSKSQIMFLSAKCLVTEEILLNIIDDLVDLGEFNSYLWDKFKILWNQTFVSSIQDAYKKRKNNCITIDGLVDLLGLKVDPKALKRSLNGNGNTQRKEKDSKENKIKEDNSILSLSSKHDIPYEEIINDLNLKANTNYKHTTDKTRKLIKARWNEKFTLDNFKTAHTNLCKYWLGTEMATYVRPDTIYTGKFDSYVNFIPPIKAEKKGDEWL